MIGKESYWMSGAAARTGNFSKIRCRKYNKSKKRGASNK